MAKIIDIILIMLLVVGLAAVTLYKLVLWFRYRYDPAKREALIASGQVYPKWLARFIFDEDADTNATKALPPNLGRK